MKKANTTAAIFINTRTREALQMGQKTEWDCVVIGQGAAGLSAALEAARLGASVVSLSKTRAGGGTCTIYAGGGFTLGVGGLPVDEHKKMTLETGRNLNLADLLDVFSSDAPGILAFLESAGVPFKVRRGGIGLRRDPAFPLLGGKPLTDNLQKACANQGVKFIHNAAVARLLQDQQGVSGVEWIDYSNGTVCQLRAGSVILACGGGGALYERTDNPQRITGDGYRLALEASCSLMDMEFVQFYPIGIDIPGGAHWFIGLPILDSARITDSKGREFLKEMLQGMGIASGGQANLLARDKCSVAIAQANLSGPVLLHTEDIPKEKWQTNSYLSPIARMFPKTAPPWSGPVAVHPIEHYFPGGVSIGTRGETEMPGLFACGEVTGGVDGANRVGGNALTNCVVFGRRAGASAAKHAKGCHVPPYKRPAVESENRSANGLALEPSLSAEPITLETPKTRSAASWLSCWREGKRDGQQDSASGPVSPERARNELRALSSQNLTPLRNREGLLSTVGRLDALRDALPCQRVRDSRSLLLAMENLGLWHTAATITMAALTREESRGAHFRDDFPDEDPGWQRHIYISDRQGDHKLKRSITGLRD